MKITKEISWRCSACGYLHYHESAPETCPICNAKATEFREIAVAVKPEERDVGHVRIVIVGAGIAGVSAAETSREHAPEAEIILISKENERPYYRTNLTRLLAGDIVDEDLPLHSERWFDEHRIQFMPGIGVESIVLAEKSVQLDNGDCIQFDKLIVATGSRPWMPDVPGTGLEKVYAIRTRKEVHEVLSSVRPGTRVVCIGGGILGLETASALAKREAEVTVLEAFDYLMPKQLNPQGSGVLQKHVESLGITVITSAIADCIIGDGAVTGVHLKRGLLIPAEVVVVTAGDRANMSILQEAGLPCRHGVLVDNFLRTSNPDIFAVGDVAEHDGICYGAWAPAMYQGKIAGLNAAGIPTEFGGIPRSHLLKVVGKPMVSIGVITPTDGSYQLIEDFPENGYRMFMFRDGLLVGSLLIGKLKLMKSVRKAIQMKLDLRELISGQCNAERIAMRISEV
jgi:nitrite reductase (NADH) large subunit